MTFDRFALTFAAGVLLSGCHIFGKLTPDCHSAQEYQRAPQVAPLKVPEGLEVPNTQGALVIPTVEMTAPPLGPKDQCYDVPPRYKAASPNKAAAAG